MTEEVGSVASDVRTSTRSAEQSKNGLRKQTDMFLIGRSDRVIQTVSTF